MKIDSYDFGRIVVDGVSYTSDVIIAAGKVNSSWWRKNGHLLVPADIESVLGKKPDLLIIGTGHSGVMKVPPETQEFLGERGIEFVIQRTEEACKTFNKNVGVKNVVAALHLTC